MKTIFITIYDGMISKNILRSEAFDALKNRGDLRIVLIVDQPKKEVYQKEFSAPNIVIEAPLKFEHKILERAWSRFLAQLPRTETVKLLINGSPLSPEKSFLRKKFLFFISFLFAHKICRLVLRKIDKIIFSGWQFVPLFEKYRPDLVFAPNIFAMPDVWALKQAQKRGVKNIGMVKSWDNPSSKGLFRVHPDRLIVHNDLLKKEVAEIDDYPEEKVFVSGIPQYDIYFRNSDFVNREKFWIKYGIASAKKIILYLEPGLMLAPRGEEMWEIMNEFLEKKQIEFPAEIFVSVHPAYPIKNEIAEKLSGIKFVRLGKYASKSFKSWEFSNDDMLELAQAVKFSDLVVNTGSTMNIEAAILDKPIINIAFDGFKKLGYSRSVRQYYDFNHLKNIVKTGGVKIAYSKDELLGQINELLKNPNIGAEERTKITKEQCAFTDGHSGERLGNYILEFLK
ncbi:MAG: CDP-glycerol glycerophosphotransferase family protein [bacterium]|nr:CDP-glycerol glycerophosphotransferase family protein [bacterium]